MGVISASIGLRTHNRQFGKSRRSSRRLPPRISPQRGRVSRLLGLREAAAVSAGAFPPFNVARTVS